jgi:hypothetical protein
MIRQDRLTCKKNTSVEESYTILHLGVLVSYVIVLYKYHTIDIMNNIQLYLVIFMCGLSHGKVICNMIFVFNTTVFHNISAISLWSLILMGKTTDLSK